MENVIKTDTSITNAPKKDYCAPMHTTEHILNQTMIRLFDCGRCFSAHVEAKKSKCDYHFSRSLTETDIANIEAKVNEVILSNLEVRSEYLSKEEAVKIVDLSKLPENSTRSVLWASCLTPLPISLHRSQLQLCSSLISRVQKTQ